MATSDVVQFADGTASASFDGRFFDLDSNGLFCSR
jgi:hypothetical protein